MPSPGEAHLDQDRLIAFALGDLSPSSGESAHLSGCSACSAELASLSTVAHIGREVDAATDSAAPPDRVWDAIATQTVELTPEAAVPAQPAASSQSAPPVPVPVHRPRGNPWRRLGLAAALGVLGVAFIAGMVSGLRSVPDASSQSSTPAVSALASASLTPQAAAAHAAGGSALLMLVDGRTMLRVRTSGMPRSSGFYEVWLVDPGTGRVVSLGTVDGGDSVDLPVPAAVDPHVFRVVEVSAQRLDGGPARGVGMLRGSLH